MRALRSKGFTLLELMTSIVITIIILLAVAASFTAVQTIYQREAQLKASVETGRVATGYIERVTRFIGYGLDPRFAIDVGTGSLGAIPKSNYQSAAVTNVYPGPGFITDDFAFRYRDPNYVRRGTYDGTNVVLDLTAPGMALAPASTFNIALQAGRLLQIVCSGGTQWAVVKTTAATPSGGATVGAGSANDPGNPTSFPTPAVDPCFLVTGANAPYVMLVREVRLRVIPLGTAPNIRNFLVAYNSIDQTGVGTTATDFDPIAADVESFQVSYMMNKGPVGSVEADRVGGDWILGNETAAELRVPTAVAPRPVYDTGYSDPLRYNTDVANVRAVVFDLSTRSFRPEKRSAFPQPRLADDPVAPAASDGYFHVSVSTTVRTPNLASRCSFTPPLKVASAPNLNDWGG